MDGVTLGLRRGEVRLAEPTPRWAALYEDEARRLRAALAPFAARIEHCGSTGVPGHEVFGRGDPRTHLLHVVPLHGPAWARMLRFRDALRASSTLAAEYATLKRALAVRYPTDRAAYTDAKAGFIDRVLAGGETSEV